MRVTASCLPPAYVILSSNIAYQVLLLIDKTKLIKPSALYQYWPGNFDTKGNPVKSIEPQGAPALVRRANGVVGFAAVDSYVFMGTPGVENTAQDIDVARASRPWINAAGKGKGFHVVTANDPNEIDLTSYPFEIDYERWDQGASCDTGQLRGTVNRMSGRWTVFCWILALSATSCRKTSFISCT
ncbi:hypothetical protein SLS54_005774 [Diplodia seriata]